MLGTLRIAFLEEGHRQGAFLGLHSLHYANDLDRGGQTRADLRGTSGYPGWPFHLLEANPRLQFKQCAAFTHIEDSRLHCRSSFPANNAP
jgi:hypothetical protein